MDSFPIIADMVQEAERHADALAADRVRAVEYYRGTMSDTPSDDGRSSATTRDLRSHIKKVLPSVMRTILGADEVVEFQPMAEGDEEAAQQASDYINYVVLKESGAEHAIEDAIHDALLLRNGILKVWYDERQAVKISRHTGITEMEYTILASDDDTEVLEYSEREEQTDEGPITVYDAKIRRTYWQREVKAGAVPRERFLIHPDAVSLSDSLITGEKTEVRRSDLVAMGYDRDVVEALQTADDDDDDRRDIVTDADEAQRANEPVTYYDLYIRIDMDEDGVSELRHMCFAGGLGEKNLLVDEECDEVQFYDITALRSPHQWEGISLADDLMDIQRIKTVLLRQTLDNLYWQNNPQPIYQSDAVQNPEAILNPEFGLGIEIKAGIDVRSALAVNSIPFVAKESFGMLEYLDQEAQERTGVSDASAGLAPDALQNMTAKASAMIEQAGIGQTEMLVRTIAKGLEGFFRGLLRTIVRHQDKPRTVRLRDEWVTFDPRHWNADMDVTVNTGLGAGTRERDMAAMTQVLALQEKLLTAFGPSNPFVKPDNLYNSVAKMIESAGLKTPRLYVTEPDPQEVQALMQAQASQVSPEQMKVEAQKEIEQAKMIAQRDKERAQMEADLTVERARMESDQVQQRQKLASDATLQERELAWEREKFYADLDFQRDKAASERQDSIWQAQAKGIAAE